MIQSADYDVIVIGGGTMGMAAGYYLTKEKKRVLVLDRHTIPNTYGSHHGHTRMFRFSYGNGSRYVPLLKKAHELWLNLEKESGKQLFVKTGALSVGGPDSHFVKEALQSARDNELDAEELTAEMIMERWPGITVPSTYSGCFDPESGYLLSEESIQAYRELAEKRGAVIRQEEPAEAVHMEDDSVQVVTALETYQAKKLVVTAGAWIPSLLPEMKLPIQPVRKTIGWFTPMKEKAYSSRFPCFVFDTENLGHYYGFPDVNGEGVKLGRMDGGENAPVEQLDRDFGSLEEDEGDLRRFLEKYLPGAAGSITKGSVCMFSNTPDSDFIIDTHPEYSNVVIAGGFSGHGFKFGSIIGKILSDLASTGQTEEDISFLQMQRWSGVHSI